MIKTNCSLHKSRLAQQKRHGGNVSGGIPGWLRLTAEIQAEAVPIVSGSFHTSPDVLYIKTDARLCACQGRVVFFPPQAQHRKNLHAYP